MTSDQNCCLESLISKLHLLLKKNLAGDIKTPMVNRVFFAFVLPRDQFQIFSLENFLGLLCAGGCEKFVYMPEILVTLGVLRSPARFFVDKRCSFHVTDSETIVLVTLY